MKYKAFQDFYIEENIKHLVLHEHNGILISPPFATEKCRDYNKVLCIDGDTIRYIDLELPSATSKFNAVTSIDNSVWFIPYGIWDDFNVVVQLKDFSPIYHKIDKPGKGQFYNIATDGATAFSFPLGYEHTSYGIFIKDEQVNTIDIDRQEHIKLHMGCVFANGKYWSAPRSDTPGYVNMVSFDGDNIQTYPIYVNNPDVTRKYTDIIVKGNTLYSLPFGETPGLTELLEFDTETNTYILHELKIPDFAKKYNVGVLVNDVIIALPYGDEHYLDSNWGLVYDTITGEHFLFDIGLKFGGKYRFRSGIEFNNMAVFFPTGTPTCPIMCIDSTGIIKKIELPNLLVGRPILHKNKLCTIAYHIQTEKHFVLSMDSSLEINLIEID